MSSVNFYNVLIAFPEYHLDFPLDGVEGLYIILTNYLTLV